MKKKMRSIIALVFVFCFVIALGSNCSAVNKQNESIRITNEMRIFLESEGVSVSDNAVLKRVSIKNVTSGESMGNALCLSQIRNGIVSSDYFMLAELTNDQESDNLGRALNSISSFSVDYPIQAWDNRFLVHATARWTLYNSIYVQPIDLTWTYHKNDSSVTVNYISVSYNCYGVTLSYPGLVVQSTDTPCYVTRTVSNPVENVLYTKSSGYNTNYCINPTQGSPSGQFLVFTSRVNNGNLDSYSFSF